MSESELTKVFGALDEANEYESHPFSNLFRGAKQVLMKLTSQLDIVANGVKNGNVNKITEILGAIRDEIDNQQQGLLAYLYEMNNRVSYARAYNNIVGLSEEAKEAANVLLAPYDGAIEQVRKYYNNLRIDLRYIKSFKEELEGLKQNIEEREKSYNELRGSLIAYWNKPASYIM